MSTVRIPRSRSMTLQVLSAGRRIGSLGRATGATRRRLPWVLSVDGVYWRDGEPNRRSGFSVLHCPTIRDAELSAEAALRVGPNGSGL